MSSRTSSEKLVYMANQIATYFSTQPGDDGAKRVAEHLRSYWEPRMRARIFEMLDTGEAADLSPLARAGVEIWRREMNALPAHSEVD